MSKVPSRWRFSKKALKLEVFTLTAALAVLLFIFIFAPSHPVTGRAWKHGRPCVVPGFCMENAILLTRVVRGSTGGRVRPQNLEFSSFSCLSFLHSCFDT